MTKIEKIEEIIREYENGTDTDMNASDVLKGIENVINDYRSFDDNILRLNTPAGELCVSVMDDGLSFSSSIYLVPENGDGETIDIAYAEVKNKAGSKDVEVSVYEDPATDDPTKEFTIARTDVAKALGIEEKTAKHAFQITKD